EAPNYFFVLNQMQQQISSFVNDILTDKTICQRVFVNEETGAIEYLKVDPYTVKVVGGTRKDYKDCTAILHETTMSVHSFIKFIGNDFDFEKEMPFLIQAVNCHNGTTFSCVGSKGVVYFGEHNLAADRYCEINTFMNYTIQLGYIEWREINANSYKETKSDYHGNVMRRPMALD